MCCGTHPLRDEMDRQAGVEFQLAEREDFRCRCPHFGSPCDRRMDGEDFLCEWCRAKGLEGHKQWCYENESVGGYGPSPSVSAAQYDEVQYPSQPPLIVTGEYTNFTFKPGALGDANPFTRGTLEMKADLEIQKEFAPDYAERMKRMLRARGYMK
jgi:hypothetical protein